MDVNEYIGRAKRKIYLIGSVLLNKVENVAVCSEVETIYDLSESIKIVSDELTSSECINKTIVTMSNKYDLDSLDYDTLSGIGAMAIDDNVDFNVFRIYI